MIPLDFPLCYREEYNRAVANASKPLPDAIDELHDIILRNLCEGSHAIPSVFPQRAQSPQDSHRLCRVVGMVQEIEPSISVYRASKDEFIPSAGLDSFAEIPDGESLMELVESQLMYVVPVPGSRHLYDDSLSNKSVASSAPHQLDRKRAHESTDDVLASGFLEGEPFVQKESLRCGEAPPASFGCQGAWEVLNLPHPPIDASLTVGCIVILFSKPQSVRTNDIVEFFGFLEPLQTLQRPADEDEKFNEFSSWYASRLPNHLVPRMRCVAHHHRSHTTFLPKLEATLDEFPQDRRETIDYLRRQICSGDPLLAEVLLLHLVSTVYLRHQHVPIGDVPLYVSHPTFAEASSAVHWARTLQDICPVGCVTLDVNSPRRMFPSHDVNANALLSGQLQLPCGTDVIVWSGGSAKPICESATEDFFDLLHRQMTKTVYPFHTVENFTELFVIILSPYAPDAQPSTILRVACHVPWCPTHVGTVEGERGCAPSQAQRHRRIREYLTRTRELPREFAESDEASMQEIAKGLAQQRAAHPSWFNADPIIHNNTMNVIMSLSRGHAASLGRTRITYADFEYVVGLYAQMKTRSCPNAFGGLPSGS
jgi:hypothetical protein